MGGFSSSNPLVAIGTQAIDAYTGIPVASGMMQMAEARAAQKAQSDQANALYERNLGLMEMQKQRRERDRLNLLKRAQAEQRARLGAFGGGTSTGSGAALLAGLAKDAGTDLADLQMDFDIRKQEMDDQMDRQRRAMKSQAMAQNMGMAMNMGTRMFNLL